MKIKQETIDVRFDSEGKKTDRSEWSLRFESKEEALDAATILNELITERSEGVDTALLCGRCNCKIKRFKSKMQCPECKCIFAEN